MAKRLLCPWEARGPGVADEGASPSVPTALTAAIWPPPCSRGPDGLLSFCNSWPCQGRQWGSQFTGPEPD